MLIGDEEPRTLRVRASREEIEGVGSVALEIMVVSRLSQDGALELRKVPAVWGGCVSALADFHRSVMGIPDGGTLVIERDSGTVRLSAASRPEFGDEQRDDVPEGWLSATVVMSPDGTVWDVAGSEREGEAAQVRRMLDGMMASMDGVAIDGELASILYELQKGLEQIASGCEDPGGVARQVLSHYAGRMKEIRDRVIG